MSGTTTSVRSLSFTSSDLLVSIETTGALKPKEIFEEAVMEFMKKINMMRTELAKLKSHPDSMEADS